MIIWEKNNRALWFRNVDVHSHISSHISLCTLILTLGEQEWSKFRNCKAEENSCPTQYTCGRTWQWYGRIAHVWKMAAKYGQHLLLGRISILGSTPYRAGCGERQQKHGLRNTRAPPGHFRPRLCQEKCRKPYLCTLRLSQKMMMARTEFVSYEYITAKTVSKKVRL